MANQATETEFTFDTAAELATAEGASAAIRGRSPWYLDWRRLRHNYTAFAFLGLFLLILFACILAPVYAKHVAKIDGQSFVFEHAFDHFDACVTEPGEAIA